ncbi:MAG TPA: hypothetical protein VK718_11805 [Ferruginibacter sp.]|jgi:hypothetical protein|nr:hypothetical protein [Ferruginibacter sp.]
MTYNKFNTGSEWRKWDLHVHTPYSLVNHFTGATDDEKWELFIKDLESLPEEFKVLGINDYLFIEGYKKVLEYRKKGRLKNIETILPVVEFRIKKFAGHKDFKRINFHVIFSDVLEPHIIESQFLNGLNGKYKLTPGLNGITWNGLITKDSLIDLGIAIKKSVPSEQLPSYGSDLEEGFNNLNLDEEDILKLLKDNTYLKGKFLTAVGKTEWETLSWNDQSIAEKKDIINKADLVFISSANVDACYNAKRKLTEQGVNNLLLDCSDAHYNISSLQKDRIGKCYTWIKADPTFDGLKQIVFEPSSRLLIQDEQPETKTNYNVIEKIRFIANENSDLFPTDFIQLNPNLNVIIGGKSSGKSLLLFHIAKTIDPDQVAEKLGVVNENEYDLRSKVEGFDFEVDWKDGLINKLNDDSDGKTRQITYVPQMYINHLAEQKGEKKLTELIDNILLQNIGFKQFKDAQHKRIHEINLETLLNVNEIFTLKEGYQQIQQQSKELGDKPAIDANILRINAEIIELNQKAGFSPEETIEYSQLQQKRDNYINGKERIEVYKEKLQEYIILIENNKVETKQKIESISSNWYEFSDDNIANFFIAKNKKEDSLTIDVTFDAIIKKYQKVAVNVEISRQTKIKNIAAIDIKLLPFAAKITNQGLLGKLKLQLAKDQSTLKQIEEKQKQLKGIADEGARLRSEILAGTIKLFDIYKLILEQIVNPELSEIGNGLALKTTLEIDIASFQNGFCGLLDGRSNFNTLFGASFDASNNYIYSEDTHIQNIESIFAKVWSAERNQIKFRSGYDSKDAILQLLKDNFKFKYNIIYNGDNILQMSPGKRGLVLMQIILHLSNAKHPILIDQPEDNLDNRTIFNDLNEFIKDKKIQRQIILVTHNANLVVSTDAEQVIVANQNGQDKGKTNEKYQFEYVTGSLEHTFKAAGNSGVLQQMGIREHVCDILEGGEDAFLYRERKYGFK